MLFKYQYIHHDAEKLHEFYTHLVKKVWCKASSPFTLSMLHQDFQPIVGKKLFNLIEEIYTLCIPLSTPQKKKLSLIFDTNNAIEKLCGGRGNKPVYYDALNTLNAGLGDKIKILGMYMYEVVLSGSAVFKKNYKGLRDHYNTFVKTNNTGICPYCGLMPIKSERRSTRDAYDHYLSKGVYPFNSVNFRNLSPMCHDCNSCCKKTDNPLIDKKKKPRKAYYSFDTVSPDWVLSVKIKSLDPINPAKNNLFVEFSSIHQPQEVNTWRDVFNIDERYNDFLKTQDAQSWLADVQDFALVEQTTLRNAALRMIAIGKNRPINNKGFLRMPFIEACTNSGIFK
jgi:hypothetical protein